MNKGRRAARAARTARKLCAALVLFGAICAFLASGEMAARMISAIASWQLFPAAGRAIGSAAAKPAQEVLTAGAVALSILLGTALLGRWYCAALCPLGSLQDLASLLRRRKRSYVKAVWPLRITALVAVSALAAAGLVGLASWLDPWSIFSRFMTYDLQSLLRLARREDLPGFSALAASLSAIATLAVLGASFARGRWFCGNLCPVGTVLGALASIAPLRLRLDRGACVSCGTCSSVCRASCIDAGKKRLESSRCVNCLECLASCPTGALRYGARRLVPKRQRDPSGAAALDGRREGGMTRASFLALAESCAVSLPLILHPGRAFAAGSSSPSAGGLPVLPPGARSLDRFLRTCVACGLCIGRCPSKVLQPSLGQHGARGFMMPRLDHGVSYCQFDCTACMDVCPSAALEKLGLERKHVAKIGDAILVRTRCVVFTQGTKCGACAEHCPTGAVRMVVGETGLPEPLFSSAICIGCGACHHACPVKPVRAISVSGLARQGVADRPSEGLFDRKDAPGDGAGSADGAPPATSTGDNAPAQDEFPF